MVNNLKIFWNKIKKIIGKGLESQWLKHFNR